MKTFSILIIIILSAIFTLTYFSNKPSTLTTTDNNEKVLGEFTKLKNTEFLNYISTDNNIIIIDVRTAEEFNAGHIDNSINLDYYKSNFRNELDNLDKNAKYAIYCRSGNRSNSVLTIMQNMGFTNVTELIGGIQSL